MWTGFKLSQKIKLRFPSVTHYPQAVAVVDRGGGGELAAAPLFSAFIFHFFAFHHRGRSCRRTVPLPHNVNVSRIFVWVRKKMWQYRIPGSWILDLPLSIYFAPPPFSQILNPPLCRGSTLVSLDIDYQQTKKGVCDCGPSVARFPT